MYPEGICLVSLSQFLLDGEANSDGIQLVDFTGILNILASMGSDHLAKPLLQNFTTSIVGSPTKTLPRNPGTVSSAVKMRGTFS